MRPSLAFDLLEEFRHALVDRLTVSLLNRGVLKQNDFQATPEGGLYLDQDGKRRYFAEYAKELTSTTGLRLSERLGVAQQTLAGGEMRAARRRDVPREGSATK